MHPRLGLLVSLALVLTVGVPRAEARPVYVEVSAAGGVSLGRLTGQLEDHVAYFSLEDVARIVGGKVRRASGGDRASLVVRQKSVEVRRDRSQVRVDGRVLALSAPTRLRQGTWLVPGDLLVRALPAVLGTGVQVAVSATAPPARSVSVVSAPSQAPAPATPAVLRDAGSPARGAPSPEPVAAPSPDGEPGPPAAARDGGRKAAVKTERLELRYRSYPTYTRVVLEGETPLEPRLVEQGGGLVVALVGMKASGPRPVRAVRDGLIASLELTESRGAPALRVAFERAPATRKVYRLADPPRLVLDFYRSKPASVAAARAGPVGLRTIVIDPGHGGHDPGAVGPGGFQEKELTLDVARRMAALLQEDPGVKVVLTRARDQFLALRERTRLANREKADLFLSIHVNAAPGVTASGAETYFLSSEATDNAARAAAAFENKVIDLEGSSGGGARGLLRSILWDLTQSEFQQESSRLAEVLQNGLDRALRLPSRGVKQAPFYVLGGAAMPAVLVEIGFITNPQEEQRLRDDGYRDRIARALAAGVAAYKRSYDQRLGVVARR